MPPDLLRRFTPTPFQATFAHDGVCIVVSTNWQLLVDRLQDAWGSAASERAGASAFNWKVVVEADNHPEPESASRHQLNHDGLALITFGQNSFLACDVTAREGIGFIPQYLVDNADVFQRNLLPALLALMKAAVDIPSVSRC